MPGQGELRAVVVAERPRHGVWLKAPSTGRCARGNGGSHLLWADPARDLVVRSRWGAQVESLLAEVPAAVDPVPVA
ncbi:hypothetical protein AB5J72_03565 [Streptomyces sp. CG1]|uniref:hypothetical protein n=1 Tax=Streptomyces sp. CG1 TaxID=1287523 RepID=UPI0034E20079